MSVMSSSSLPSSILIIGSGVFGLSTAYALAQREEYKHTKITVVDRLEFPAPDAASIDSSRLIRSDYADKAYAALALEALKLWRGEFGNDGRYTESGLAVLHDKAGKQEAQNAVEEMLANLQLLGLKCGSRADGAQVTVLPDQAAVKAALPGFSGIAADSGYVNYTSGWAHAENGMRHLRKMVEGLNRIEFKVVDVKSLIFDRQDSSPKVLGAETTTGERLPADLTILAAGAWSGRFIDLRGITSATGQELAYLKISNEEQSKLLQNPAIINPSNYMYIIQPRDNVLKIARHSYGYSNPQQIEHPEKPGSGEMITVSLPRTKHDDANLNIPPEGMRACREYLTQCMPDFKDRPFCHTRVCWYSDTPQGDWLIDHHPVYAGLFVATGGSGHAYKFLPVIGERIADVLQSKPRDELGRQLMQKWRWPRTHAGRDYAWTSELRGGRRGMILDEELAKA